MGRLVGLVLLAGFGILLGLAGGQSTKAATLREVRVELMEWSITPSSLTVRTGDTLRFTMVNKGAFPHNLHIGGNGVEVESERVAAGETKVWEYTFGKGGTYAFYCSVGNGSHRRQGMDGGIGVLEASEASLKVSAAAKGNGIEVMLEPSGFKAAGPDGKKTPGEGHFQLFLDKQPPAADKTGPVPFEGVVHTPNSTYTFANVPPGKHVVYAQLAYGDHSPYQPLVVDWAEVTVAEEAAPAAPVAPAAPAPAQLPRTGDNLMGYGVLSALGGVAILSVGLYLRRRVS